VTPRAPFADPASLHDLEIFSTSAGAGPTVMSLVDRTRTRAGRDQLRRRLTSPAREATDIVELQRAHQALHAEPAYRLDLSRANLDGVERFLASDWQPPGARNPITRRLEGLWLRLRHGGYLREVESGRTRGAALLQAADDLRRRLAAAPETVLQRLGGDLAADLDRAETRSLLRLSDRPGTANLLAFDQIARGPGKAILARLLERLAELEAMWSLGAATAEHGWSYPRPGNRLRVVGLVHPFLGRAGLPNDLDLAAGVRVCFLTGPNMAGKSTFLKAVAVSTMLAHAGSGVPAAEMEFNPVDTIFSSIRIADNLGQGESYYLAEVRRIKALALALRDHRAALAIIDEPFRGTNVHDASEATVAVLTRLAGHPTALVFVASHLGEVVAQIQDDPRIRLLHFAAEVSDETVRFDYRLRDGASSQRLGMSLLRRERVLELLEEQRADETAGGVGRATNPTISGPE
jgi:DNA mismatch repair ATPase MutS